MTPPEPPAWRSFIDLPHAHGGPAVTGRLRDRPQDFLVEEILGFEPDGDGEHTLLLIRKTGANTEWVARRLASHAGLPVAAVGYAGMKDRRAVTTQWFSVHTGVVRDTDWSALGVQEIEVLKYYRHRRKLRRGALRGNRFQIRVRDLRGDRDVLGERLESVRRFGVPNYFGAQRFGIRDGNLHAAHALFIGRAQRVGRHLRGLWLSAARSQLFNEVLSRRVERGEWDRPLPGERMQLAGSRAHFLAEEIDEGLEARVRGFDLHPSGPLWGAGEVLPSAEVAALEREVASSFEVWAAGLATAGLRQERRPLRLPASEVELCLGADDLMQIAFRLPAGGYATAVLRELVDWTDSG